MDIDDLDDNEILERLYAEFQEIKRAKHNMPSYEEALEELIRKTLERAGMVD